MTKLSASAPAFPAWLILAIITLLLCPGVGAAAADASAEPLSCTVHVDAIQQTANLTQVIQELVSVRMEQVLDCVATSDAAPCDTAPPDDLAARFRAACEHDAAGTVGGAGVRWACLDGLSGYVHNLRAHYLLCHAYDCSESYNTATLMDLLDVEIGMLQSILPAKSICRYNYSEMKDSSDAGARLNGWTASSILLGCLSAIFMLRFHT